MSDVEPWQSQRSIKRPKPTLIDKAMVQVLIHERGYNAAVWFVTPITHPWAMNQSPLQMAYRCTGNLHNPVVAFPYALQFAAACTLLPKIK